MPGDWYDERGRTAWPVDEFLQVFEFYCRIGTTPKDDWPDFRERKVHLAAESGEVEQTLKFNGYHPMNQLAQHIHEKYDERNLASHHLQRFNQILDFLRAHEQQLLIEGICDKSEKGNLQIPKSLFEALCTLPYSKSYTEDRCRFWKFKYSEVVESARSIQIQRNANRDELE